METNNDQLTIQRIQMLHPTLRADVLSIYQQINDALTGKAICRFTQTFRTYSEQDFLYAIGRTRKLDQSPVTNARGGESYHNFGLAFDICLLVNTKNRLAPRWQTNIDYDNDSISDWIEVVTIVKSHGWDWGGDWKSPDYPHFQKTFGYSVSQLDQLLRNRQTCYAKFYPEIAA